MTRVLQTAAPKPKRNKAKDFLRGDAIEHIDVVRAKFRQRHFNYQFLMPDGNRRTRIHYCDNPGELEFIAGVMSRKVKIFIAHGPRRIPRHT